MKSKLQSSQFVKNMSRSHAGGVGRVGGWWSMGILVMGVATFDGISVICV